MGRAAVQQAIFCLSVYMGGPSLRSSLAFLWGSPETAGDALFHLCVLSDFSTDEDKDQALLLEHTGCKMSSSRKHRPLSVLQQMNPKQRECN